MDNLEKVEKLREKTGVTYEEAKSALESCNWDMLDALLYLEALGKINEKTAVYTTSAAPVSNEFEQAQKTYEKQTKGSSFGETMDKFFSWCAKIAKRGWEIKFKVVHEGEEKISIPLLVVALFVIFAFWISIPLLIVGLIFGCRYQFEGMDTVSVNLNDLSDKASNMVNDIKKDMKEKKNEQDTDHRR